MSVRSLQTELHNIHLEIELIELNWRKCSLSSTHRKKLWVEMLLWKNWC